MPDLEGEHPLIFYQLTYNIPITILIIHSNYHLNNPMRLEIQIESVVAVQPSCYFIAVQIDYHDQVTQTQKLRTDIHPPTHRPKFARNLFTFHTLVHLQTLKFGLMAVPDANESNLNQAKLIGLGSIRLNLQSLKQLPAEGTSKLILFQHKNKEMGQFNCKIRFLYNHTPSLSNSKLSQQTPSNTFNPLISRVLYTDQGSKDPLRMENSIKLLEKQSQQLYADFKTLKAEEQTLERIMAGLNKDEEQLRSEIEVTEKLNEKISNKIAQKQQLEPLTLQIEMLKNTQEGKRLLLEKLQYFQSRIQLQEIQHDKLALEYEKIKHQLDARIKKAQNYAQKLKGKEMQEFELHRNRQILKKYQDVQYEFSCNQNIIATLAKQIPKNELNGTQAALLLSQVNFHLQLQKLDSNCTENEKIVHLIQRQAESIPLQSSEQTEEQRLVLGIKLNALQEQIATVRAKLRGVVGKRQIQESMVKRM